MWYVWLRQLVHLDAMHVVPAACATRCGTCGYSSLCTQMRYMWLRQLVLLDAEHLGCEWRGGVKTALAEHVWSKRYAYIQKKVCIYPERTCTKPARVA